MCAKLGDAAPTSNNDNDRNAIRLDLPIFVSRLDHQILMDRMFDEFEREIGRVTGHGDVSATTYLEPGGSGDGDGPSCSFLVIRIQLSPVAGPDNADSRPVATSAVFIQNHSHNYPMAEDFVAMPQLAPAKGTL
ncbi:hypothetical protein NML43_05310 [Rhodopseudomonas palustris]|uniref:hypothetical protein n=1 Tax=Rhodopseudomonas palustris TaxID=1076 RepID=UPI0020CD5456|nr:hypothetical protein [Rhodopseudomonas palustris]MCP9626509.1 hypothetical protein [Rhodopseudomonas palustris]